MCLTYDKLGTEKFLEFIRGVCYIIDTKEETTAHKVVDLQMTI